MEHEVQCRILMTVCAMHAVCVHDGHSGCAAESFYTEVERSNVSKHEFLF